MSEIEEIKYFKNLTGYYEKKVESLNAIIEGFKVVAKEAEERTLDWQHKYSEAGEIIQQLRNELFELKHGKIQAEERVKELELLLENESKPNANHMELWNDALDKIRELEKELLEKNESHNKLEHDLQTNLTLLKDGVREHKWEKWGRSEINGETFWEVDDPEDEQLYSILEEIEKGEVK